MGTPLIEPWTSGKSRRRSSIRQVDAAINQNIAAILISHGLVGSEFLWRWFSVSIRGDARTRLWPPGFELSRVRGLTFVLPPPPEQHEIVRRVESLFVLADRIEARLAKARRQVDALTPSLLARAFRGELVPQNPTDEPASLLLERIKTAT